MSPFHRYRITLFALALLFVLIGLWWAAILGVVPGAAVGAARLVVPLLGAASVGALVERWWFLEPPWPDTPEAAADRDRALRRGRSVLLGLLVLALLVRLVGIAHEVEERSYRDEGTYYHHATQINEGEVVRRSFVYPHLLYNAYALTLWSARAAAALWPVSVDELFLPDQAMIDGDAVRFSGSGQWVAARGEWPAGRCEVLLAGNSLDGARLEARNLAGRSVQASSGLALDLPEGGRWILSLFADPPAVLRGLEVNCGRAVPGPDREP